MGSDVNPTVKRSIRIIVENNYPITYRRQLPGNHLQALSELEMVGDKGPP